MLAFLQLGTAAVAQEPALTLRTRGYVQQLFADGYVRQHDSTYFLQHNAYRPFTSERDVDSFLQAFTAAWEKKAGGEDSNLRRLDSYVYGLVERSKRGGDWSEPYVWAHYMVPAFLADFRFCQAHPEPVRARLLWPGNAGNIFVPLLRYDLPAADRHRLEGAYDQMPALLEKYLALAEMLDSNDVKSLHATQATISWLRTFFAVTEAIEADNADQALALLLTAFSDTKTPLQTLARPIRNLAIAYAKAGKADEGLAVLDLAMRSTADADVPRDSLGAWYTLVDATSGAKRYADALGHRAAAVFVPWGDTIALSGSYNKVMTGKPFDLATLRGKTVLLDFWTTWCKPCKAEIPELDAFATRYANRNDFVLVSVSSDAVAGGASQQAVRDTASSHKINYVVLYDRPDPSLTKLFAVEGWPSKYLLDPEGRLLKRPQQGSAVTLKAVEEYLDARK